MLKNISAFYAVHVKKRKWDKVRVERESEVASYFINKNYSENFNSEKIF